MSNNRESKGTVVALAQKLMAGTTKHLTGTTPVLLGGSSYTPSQINDKLQAIVNLRSDVDASKASTKAKLTAETTQMPALRTFTGALVSFIKGAYASQPDVLADFGISPKARTPLTAEAKTAAVVKRAATRAARHTLGTVQKKSVKGAVTGITVTPISTAAPQPTVTAPSNPTAPATSVGTTVALTPTH